LQEYSRHFEELGIIFLLFFPPWDMQEQCKTPEISLNGAS
jgi:hypothetical protein